MKTENPMGTRKILPLLLTMAVPPMVSMFIQSLYNIVDSAFVARLGEDAITSVSIAFPLQNLILAAAVGLGVGLNACIAMNLGSGNKEAVNLAATNGIILTFLHSLFFVFAGIFFVKPYLAMFSQNEQVLKWSIQYSQIVICFAFGGLFHINIEKMFQAQGNMVLPMIMQIVGAIINIILDPILIFGKLGFPALGVRGAAIATVIGQLSACILAIILFMKKHGSIRISLTKYRLDKEMVKRIYSIGIPSGIMMALPSVLVSILNGILGSVSQTAVAVFGLYYKIQTFVYMPSSGVVQGMRPLISYNYGAGLYKRLRQIIKVSIYSVALIMAAGTLIFIGFPKQILNIFSANETMLSMGVPAFRIISAGFIVSSIGLIFSGVFEALGKGGESLLISLLRQLIIIPPLALVLGHFAGITGIWLAFPAAETAASIAAILLMRKTLRNMKPEAGI